MTWFEFRSRIDEFLAENCIDGLDVEMDYVHLPDMGEELEIKVEKGKLVCYPVLNESLYKAFRDAVHKDLDKQFKGEG